MSAPDLTYSCPDGIWTRFYPETSAGEDAWRTMAAADPQGVVAFLPGQVPGVIEQLKAAGYSVAKLDRETIPTMDQVMAEFDEIFGELTA